MPIPIIAGNWKMNTTLDEAAALVKAMLEPLDRVQGVEKVLCPPFVSLARVGEIIRGSSVKLGAQNMYFVDKGAYTGEISPTMLAGLCQYVILGHSERRLHLGETDAMINEKVKAALRVGLRPILCVGERLEENEAGRTEEVVARQVRAALSGIASPQGLVMAYEPVWAIGTGRAATGPGANATIAFIRGILAQQFGSEVAQGVPIQYGGSVTPANIAEFMAQPEVDGALVGGASLKAEDFLSIVQQAAATKGGG